MLIVKAVMEILSLYSETLVLYTNTIFHSQIEPHEGAKSYLFPKQNLTCHNICHFPYFLLSKAVYYFSVWCLLLLSSLRSLFSSVL